MNPRGHLPACTVKAGWTVDTGAGPAVVTAVDRLDVPGRRIYRIATADGRAEPFTASHDVDVYALPGGSTRAARDE